MIYYTLYGLAPDFTCRMEDLPDAVAFTDPITAVFELNEEMVKRVSRIGYIVDYAFWAGVILSMLSGIGSLVFWVTDADLVLRVLAPAALIVSPVVAWYARKERQFLDEYRVLASAVNRAKDWEPNPEIPEGDDPLERLLKYLEEQDERFAYLYRRRPRCLKESYTVQGLEEESYTFDAYFACTPYPWYRVQEGLRLLVKVLPVVEIEDIQELMDAAMDALEGGSSLPTRIILLQTDEADFPDEVVEHVDENWVEYDRSVGRDNWDWASPIELMAEDPEGQYNFGSFYFG